LGFTRSPRKAGRRRFTHFLRVTPAHPNVRPLDIRLDFLSGKDVTLLKKMLGFKPRKEL
jgi:hypothetical protein